MILEAQLPAVAQQINTILAELANKTAVQWVTLAAKDGLLIDEINSSLPQLAAIVSFLGASVGQACVMLGFQASDEIAIHMENGRLLVIRIFKVNDIQLLLAVVFAQEIAHRRLLNQTIQAIQQTLEEENLWV